MHAFINSIAENLQSIVEQGGYAFLFITTLFEGIPVIGQFIPGHTIVIIAGFLSKLEVLNIYTVTVIVIISALLGDIIGFFMGRKYGFAFLTRFGKFFFIKESYIEKARSLVQQNTVKTIIIGRLSPLTRPFSPFIIGASGVRAVKFWILDCIAVALWSVLSIGVGYIFGASYHTASTLLGKYIVIAILLGILIIIAYRFINKQFHIFAKYELITLGLNLFGLYLFFKTIQDALTDKLFLLELDLYVNNFFILHAKEPWLSIMDILTNIISPELIIIVGFLAIVYFIYRKKFYYLTITALSLIGGYISTSIIKYLVMRIRPEGAFIMETGFSFPSGHATMATIFFTLIIYTYIIKIKSLIWREVLIVISVLLLLLTAFSRVYLGVHWLSDVFAGIGLGLFWTTLIVLLVKYGMMIRRMLRRELSE